MYDVIVIGARCAGSPSAMLLARKGYRVLLVDRKTFPSDTVSSHFIWHGAIARLRKWGLLDAIVASGCPPIRKITFDFGDIAFSSSPAPVDGIDATYAPRRSVLDKILIDAARTAGAEVRERFLVTGILASDSCVTGIIGSAEGGSISEIHARVVIGADGAESILASSMSPRMYEIRPSGCSVYYSHWSGVPDDGFHLYLREGFAGGLFPTNDGNSCVLAAWTHDAFPHAQQDITRTYRQVLAQIAPLADRIRHGKQAERILGATEIAPYLRVPFGEGWALAGDAGCRRNPITAQGIAGAFRDADLLADALDNGLSGRESMANALAGYELLRNEAEMPMYEFTAERSQLRPLTAGSRELYTQFSRDPAGARRYLGVLAGTLSAAAAAQAKH